MQIQIPNPAKYVHQGATVQQTYVFPVNQPEQSRYGYTQYNRYVVDAKIQANQGATVLRTDPIPPVSRPEMRYYFPDINRYTPSITGPVEQFNGATIQQTYIFPPNQPELIAYKNKFDTLRYIVDVAKRFDGATVQQTYIFPPNEPELNAYRALAERNRYIIEVRKQVDQGSTVQQTYLFPPNEPEFSYYKPHNELRTLESAVRPIEGSTIQQTYVFPPNQPELIAYSNRAAILQYIVEVKKQQDQGATVQQTYIFPIMQPNRKIDNYIVYNPQTNIITNVPVSAIHKYYTGQFHTTKTLLRRGIGF